MAYQSGRWPQHSMKPIPQCPKSKNVDVSALQLPIETTVTGLKQAFSVLVNGHPNIVDLLVNEANIIYECRSCLNFYRCITSFISHKRHFCKKRSSRRANTSTEDGRSLPGVTIAQISDQNMVRMVQEPKDVGLKLPEFNLSDYSPSLNLLKDLDILRQSGVKKSLETIVQSICSGGKTNVPNNYFRDKINELDNNSQTESLTFAEFYEKRMNPRCRTAVLDPTGKVIQPGPPSKQFKQTMANYRDEVNRAIMSQSNIYPCPKCDRHFPSVNKTTSHLSTAHLLSADTSVGYTQSIVNKRLPNKRLQVESSESILQKKYTVNIMRRDDVERAVQSKIEERNARADKEPKLLADEVSISNHRPNGLTCVNPNRSLLPKPKILNGTSSVIKPSLCIEGEDRMRKTPESLKPLSQDAQNHVSEKVLKPSIPNVILEPLTQEMLKSWVVNAHAQTLLLPSDTQSSFQGRTKRQSQVLHTSDGSVKFSSGLPEKDLAQALGNGENSEPRRGKGKQANPSLIVPTKSDPKVGPSSAVRTRKRANPAQIPQLHEMKRLSRAPLA